MRILLPILLILTYSFYSGSPSTVVGYIKINKHKVDIRDLVFLVQLESNHVLKATTMVDSNGIFELPVLADERYDLFYSIGNSNRIYLATINSPNVDTIKMNFVLPKKYKKRRGKVICPKCSQVDKVIPVWYGLRALIAVRHISSSGDTTYKPKNHYYDGGCNVSDISAKWYCERDSIQF